MKRNDEGFTLLEVLIAVSLLGIVFGIVSIAFVVSLDVSDDSTTRLSESQGGAFTSVWVTRDVQSAKTVALNSNACAAPGALGTPIINLTWDDEGAIGGTATYRVDYRLVGTALVRTSCGAGPTTHSVATSVKAVTPSCNPTPCTDEVRLVLTGVADSSFSVSAQRRLS